MIGSLRKHKRYLLFAGHNYYPLGGFNDFHDSFKSIDSAKKWFGSNHSKISDSYVAHWGQVVDRKTLKIVATFKQGFSGTVDNPIINDVEDDPCQVERMYI